MGLEPAFFSRADKGSLMTKNQRYEQRKKEGGLEKVTVWVPSSVAEDLKLMARHCEENRDLVPVACRSITTGRLSFVG